jgi:hypothetical protein
MKEFRGDPERLRREAEAIPSMRICGEQPLSDQPLSDPLG